MSCVFDIFDYFVLNILCVGKNTMSILKGNSHSLSCIYLFCSNFTLWQMTHIYTYYKTDAFIMETKNAKLLQLNSGQEFMIYKFIIFKLCCHKTEMFSQVYTILPFMGKQIISRRQ